MSTWLIWVVTAIYAIIAADLARKGQWMSLTFLGYTIANIGIILDLIRR